MTERVIDVQVPGMMRIDRVRSNIADDRLDSLDHIEQRQCIEPVVGKAEKARFVGAEESRRVLCCRGTPLRRRGIGTARANAVREEDDLHLITMSGVARQVAPAPKTSSSGCATIANTFIGL